MRDATDLSVGDRLRRRVHWGATHGFLSFAVRAAAKRGDLQARLIFAGNPGGDVWGAIEDLRAAGPVYGSRLGYVTTSHDLVKEVLSSNDFRAGNPMYGDSPLGNIALRTATRAVHPVSPPSLLVVEPPQHTRYRKLVTRVFTVKAVQRLRERTEIIASQLLDDLGAADGPVDLVEQYCAMLPVTVIAEILGVPDADRERVLAFGAAAAPSLDFGLSWKQFRSVDDGLRNFDAWLDTHLARLRTHPGDDLLSQLVHARDDEGALDEAELKSTAGLVLAAGFETTVNLLSNGVTLLQEHPDQLERLRAEPDLWPNAVDEVLRLDPPVLFTGRFTEEGAEVAGRSIQPGLGVLTVLAGANRDPDVFEDPTRFDVARDNAREHISFSGGRHFCLGASLARMEGEVGLRALFDRYPDLELLPGAYRRPTRVLRGWETLPARLKA
jgi:hypothetical protein